MRAVCMKRYPLYMNYSYIIAAQTYADVNKGDEKRSGQDGPSHMGRCAGIRKHGACCLGYSYK